MLLRRAAGRDYLCGLNHWRRLRRGRRKDSHNWRACGKKTRCPKFERSSLPSTPTLLVNAAGFFNSALMPHACPFFDNAITDDVLPAPRRRRRQRPRHLHGPPGSRRGHIRTQLGVRGETPSTVDDHPHRQTDLPVDYRGFQLAVAQLHDIRRDAVNTQVGIARPGPTAADNAASAR